MTETEKALNEAEEQMAELRADLAEDDIDDEDDPLFVAEILGRTKEADAGNADWWTLEECIERGVFD